MKESLIATKMNENMWLKICGWGGGENFQVETETWYKKGAQESMVVKLTVINNTDDIEIEEATSFSQAGIPVEL